MVEAKLTTETNNLEFGTLAYIGMALTILSMAVVIFLHYRKSKFCRRYRLSNQCKNSIIYLRCTKLYTNKTM